MNVKTYEVDDKTVELFCKIDTSNYDSHYQRRVKSLGGLYKVRDVESGTFFTAYGFELGIK